MQPSSIFPKRLDVSESKEKLQKEQAVERNAQTLVVKGNEILDGTLEIGNALRDNEWSEKSYDDGKLLLVEDEIVRFFG